MTDYLVYLLCAYSAICFWLVVCAFRYDLQQYKLISILSEQEGEVWGLLATLWRVRRVSWILRLATFRSVLPLFKLEGADEHDNKSMAQLAGLAARVLK